MSQENPSPKKQLLKIPERKVPDLKKFFEEKHEAWELVGRTVFITQKGKVVARATWDHEDRLIVNKIRRPKATRLSIGQILYDPERRRYESIPVPTRSPELKSEGLLLFRTHAYDSSEAIRPDPFWEDYEGWALIPETINDRDGLQTFLDEYPEIAEAPHQASNVNPLGTTTWKMAEQKQVDDFVCGVTNERPTLASFEPPPQKEVIVYKPVIGPTGNFEYFSLHWVNKWIVYVPRKRPIT